MSGDGSGDETTRDRGVLSAADRAYLRGDTTFASVQSERNARARIRDRVHDATLDFELLVEHLDDRDRELVFEKRFDELDGADAFDALVSALAFYYQAVRDTGLDFDAALAEAVNLAEAKRNRAATVALDVTYQSLTADQLLAKLRRGEALTLTELAYLHRSDDVTERELARYFADRDAQDVDDGRIQSKVTSFQ